MGVESRADALDRHGGEWMVANAKGRSHICNTILDQAMLSFGGLSETIDYLQANLDFPKSEWLLERLKDAQVVRSRAGKLELGAGRDEFSRLFDELNNPDGDRSKLAEAYFLGIFDRPGRYFQSQRNQLGLTRAVELSLEIGTMFADAAVDYMLRKVPKDKRPHPLKRVMETFGREIPRLEESGLAFFDFIFLAAVTTNDDYAQKAEVVIVALDLLNFYMLGAENVPVDLKDRIVRGKIMTVMEEYELTVRSNLWQELENKLRAIEDRVGEFVGGQELFTEIVVEPEQTELGQKLIQIELERQVMKLKHMEFLPGIILFPGGRLYFFCQRTRDDAGARIVKMRDRMMECLADRPVPVGGSGKLSEHELVVIMALSTVRVRDVGGEKVRMIRSSPHGLRRASVTVELTKEEDAKLWQMGLRQIRYTPEARGISVEMKWGRYTYPIRFDWNYRSQGWEAMPEMWRRWIDTIVLSYLEATLNPKKATKTGRVSSKAHDQKETSRNEQGSGGMTPHMRILHEGHQAVKMFDEATNIAFQTSRGVTLEELNLWFLAVQQNILILRDMKPPVRDMIVAAIQNVTKRVERPRWSARLAQKIGGKEYRWPMMELQSPDHPDGSLAQLPVYMITWVEDKEHTEALRVQCPGVAAEILEREEGE